jgi:hypothetical protein
MVGLVLFRFWNVKWWLGSPRSTFFSLFYFALPVLHHSFTAHISLHSETLSTQNCEGLLPITFLSQEVGGLEKWKEWDEPRGHDQPLPALALGNPLSCSCTKNSIAATQIVTPTIWQPFPETCLPIHRSRRTTYCPAHSHMYIEWALLPACFSLCNCLPPASHQPYV